MAFILIWTPLADTTCLLFKPLADLLSLLRFIKLLRIWTKVQASTGNFEL